MQTVPRIPAKDKAKELRQRIDESLDTLARAVDEVAADDADAAAADGATAPEATDIADEVISLIEADLGLEVK